MARPHIEFTEVGDVEQAEVTDGPLAGSGIRMLSEGDESGAFTAFSSFSSGWSGELGAYGRPGSRPSPRPIRRSRSVSCCEATSSAATAAE